jgi:hypothetical protein
VQFGCTRKWAEENGSDLSNGYAIQNTVGYYSEFKRAKTEWWLEKSCLKYQ